MQTSHPFRTSVFGIVVMLNVALLAPVDVRAQEEPLAAAPAIAASWDETSGYGAVEAVRAAINALPEEPAAFPVTVSNDVRWAPEGTTSPMPSLGANRDATAVYEALAYGPSRDEAVGYPAVDARRVLAARQALASGDLGSMQEEALTAVVDAGATQDDISAYGSVGSPEVAVCEDSTSRPCRK